SRHARATADARRGVEGPVGLLLGHGQGVGLGSRAGARGNEAAGLHDAVEGSAIDHQVTDDGEGGRAPRLDPDLLPVLKLPHVELADGRRLPGTVGVPVDDHAARATDALPTVVIEGDGLFALLQQPFVHLIEHLQERSVLADVLRLVANELALGIAVLLTPDVKHEIEALFHDARFAEKPAGDRAALRTLLRRTGRGDPSLVAALGRLHVLELEGLSVDLMLHPIPLGLPGSHELEVLVVALGLPLLGLVLLPEMTTAGLLTEQGVAAHELAERREVRTAWCREWSGGARRNRVRLNASICK